MKNYKFVCILIAVLMAFTLVACNSTQNKTKSKDENQSVTTKTTSEPAKNEKTVKLRLITISTDDNRLNIMNDYIKPKYQNELPNVEIEFEEGGGGEDFDNKIKTYNAAGDLPDVWYNGANIAIPIINSGNVLELTQYINEDGFIDKYSVKEALKFKDNIYALASGADTYFTPRIFYHKQIFEECGVEVPKTFDELIEVSKQIKNKGYTPITTMGKGGWAPQLFLFQNMVAIEDPQVMLDLINNKTDFNNPVVKNALDRIVTLAKEGLFADGIAMLDYGPAKEMFTSKKAAMYWMFTWELPGLAEDPDVDFFTWPSAGDKYNAEDVVQFWGSPLNGYSVFANSENVKEAVALAEFCAMQDGLYFQSTGAPVTLDTGKKLEGLTPLMEKNLAHYNGASIKIPAFMLNAMDAKTNAEFATLGANLLTGEFSADEFIKEFEKTWEENTWFD